MKREAYGDRLRQELAGVRVTPALRRRTLSAMKRKEMPLMKKKIPLALALLLAALLLGGAALAAAGYWGLLDFVGRYGGTYVPESSPAYIQQHVASWETERLTVNVREMYYDGYCLQAIVDVKPRDPGVLLVSGMYSTNDYLCNMRPDVTEQEDARTVAQYYREGGYETLLAVWPAITTDGDVHQSSFLQEDGTLTFYLETGYKDYQPVRETTLRLLIMTCIDPENDRMDRSLDERVSFPLTLTIPEGVAPVVYVCDVPQDFPEAGVRVDRLTVTALPLSLYAAIEYTAIDPERYALVADSLWFEFIDPNSTETLPALQRLDSGFSGEGGIEIIGEGRIRQFETLGVNELRDTYTLRIYDAWEKTRYESRAFPMHEVPGCGMTGE